MRDSVLLLIATLAAFGASLTSSFHFDDYALFADPAITSPSGWREVWRLEQTRPLTYFTFWVNYQLGGWNPVGYHAVSLLVHLAAVWLLRDVLSRLISARAALVAAAGFAVHPIQTEAVAYIFARGTLLATLFCLLSLRCWIADRRWSATAWFAVALLAKEECVAFPVFLFLLRRDRRGWKALGAMLVLALAAGLRVLLVTATLPAATAGFRSPVTTFEYFSTQGLVILRYFRLLLWPAGFSADPDVPLMTGWLAWLAWMGIGLLIALAWRTRAGMWFIAGLVLLAPSSSVFPAADLAADRRVYLPLVAFSAFAGLLLERVRAPLLIAVGFLLAALSFERTLVWRTEEALWSEAVRMAPTKVRPRIQLARAVDPERGIMLLREAAGLAPRDPEVAAELGRVYMAARRPAEALAEFGRALALAPNDPRALNNRGAALLALGQQEAARQDFERALERDACLFDARLNLLRLGVRTAGAQNCRYTREQREALKVQ